MGGLYLACQLCRSSWSHKGIWGSQLWNRIYGDIFSSLITTCNGWTRETERSWAGKISVSEELGKRGEKQQKGSLPAGLWMATLVVTHCTAATNKGLSLALYRTCPYIIWQVLISFIRASKYFTALSLFWVQGFLAALGVEILSLSFL